MNRVSFVLLCALAATSVVAAPHKKPAISATAGSPSKAGDPITDFKALVATGSEQKMWTRVRQNNKTKKWSKNYYALGEVKFDIKKTDSLLSPAMGLVSFPITITQSELFDNEQDAAQSTSMSTLRITLYYSGKYLFKDSAWEVDEFSFNAAVGNNPPDPTTVTLNRDQLLRAREAETGEAALIAKWIR